MKHKPYFPTVIAEKRAWLLNYQGKIESNGAAVGLDTTQITAEQTSCQVMIDEIDAADKIIIAATAKVAERDLLIKTEMTALRAGVATKKSNKGYTATIGEALNIIGSEVVVDTMNVKTVIKLATVPQGVDIKITLENCEGGNIYSMRGTEKDFTFLKHITHPHTIDTRPNLDGATSEKRQYYATLVINDEEVGIASAPETIHN